MEGVVAKFRFKGYQILETSVTITDPAKISKSLSVNFAQTPEECGNSKDFRLTLETTIKDDNNSVYIKVKTLGFFEIEEGVENKKLFFTQNAPAILFPYARAYITALTSLSGISPIILPTINFSNMTHNENNTKKPE